MTRIAFYRTCWQATVVFLALTGLSAQTAMAQAAFRGTWADIWHVGYKSRTQIDDLVNRAVQGRYNAIVAEVLGYQDTGSSAHGAYWNTSLVPRASDIQEGLPFDPLLYLCQQAHAAGIEVHAWLVAYRISTVWPPNGNTTLSAHPEWCMVPRGSIGGGPALVTGVHVLDPGSPEVQEYLVSIVRDLVSRYPIDGINWDYIRYTDTDAGYPADSNYNYSSLKRFQRIYNRSDVPLETDSGWSDFRRRTIDELVRRCRVEIPLYTADPNRVVKHTADVLASGNAPASFSSSSAYGYFQNWRYWMEMGWLDAAIPMNYKREHCTDQALWFRNWVNASNGWRYQRHMYNGQATYLNSFANSITQMQYIQNAGAHGVVSYAYATTRATETLCDSNDPYTSDWTWYSHVAANIFTSVVPTPDMPWRHPDTATEGTLWGRITDFATGQPVDDAVVQVTGRPDMRADGNGYYAVTLVPATADGTPVSMTVSKNGYTPIVQGAAYAFAGDLSRYDFRLGAELPRIAIDGQENSITLTRSIPHGESLPNDTFTVAAVSPATRGPVNYTLLSDPNWLSATPRRSISYGEADTITITYDTASLSRGYHTGVVTISDGAAENNPLTVTVNLAVTPIPVPADLDNDSDVDQQDLGIMQLCLSGPTVPQDKPECEYARLDGDSDVDGEDMALFARCVSGSGQAGDMDCLAQ